MSVETQKIEGERQRYREKDKQAKDAETEADRQEMEALPPPPGREMDRQRHGRGGPGGSRALVSGQRWTDNQSTVGEGQREVIDEAAVRLPGRELEKWRCQEHGTGCWGRTKPDCSKAVSP